MILNSTYNLWPPFGRQVIGESLRVRRISAKPMFTSRITPETGIKTKLARSTISPRSEGGG